MALRELSEIWGLDVKYYCLIEEDLRKIYEMD